MDKKILFNNKIYLLGDKETKLLLDMTRKYAPESSIFALEQFGVTEVINKSYKNKSSLKRAIKRFEDKGFNVHYKE